MPRRVSFVMAVVCIAAALNSGQHVCYASCLHSRFDTLIFIPLWSAIARFACLDHIPETIFPIIRCCHASAICQFPCRDAMLDAFVRRLAPLCASLHSLRLSSHVLLLTAL
jgi:hypothetical protein